jgi:ATP-binding protein involved in chromosome partitioning
MFSSVPASQPATAAATSNGDLTEAAVMAALDKVNDPELHQSLTSLGMIQNMRICGGNVAFDLVLTTTACPMKDGIKNSAAEAVRAVPGVENVEVVISGKTLGARLKERQPVPGIQNVLAVSSGKGGVGKTTVTVNIACALAQAGAKVGILDADIYGPNVPLMMGLAGKAITGQTEDGKLAPPENHGVKVISMAFLVKDDQPVVWRGPLLDRVIRQFLTDTGWGELDYLLIDLPPGTGDAQLTIVQATPVVGAIIVTTPQDVALLDSRKGLAMFTNANIPILGIVENMSYFMGNDGVRYEIFGHGGGARAAQQLDVPFLGEVPLYTSLRENADQGRPIVVAEPASSQAEVFRSITNQIVGRVCDIGVRSLQQASV